MKSQVVIVAGFRIRCVSQVDNNGVNVLVHRVVVSHALCHMLLHVFTCAAPPVPVDVVKRVVDGLKYMCTSSYLKYKFGKIYNILFRYIMETFLHAI